MSFINNNFGLLILFGLFFIGGFFSGSLWTENQLRRDGGLAAVPSAADPTAQAPTAPQGPTKEQIATVPKVTATDYVRGNRNAKVVLVEYSDFECPFCRSFHPTMEQVMQEYGDDVAWVYRHFPLSFHPKAQKAAEAAACVGKLAGNDAFWKYADLLFEQSGISTENIDESKLPALAAQIGVSADQVKNCLDTDETAEEVALDMNGGSTAGINGTPGTIVVTKDGGQEIISGALPFEQVKLTLDKYFK